MTLNYFEDSEVRLIKSNVDDESVALSAWVSTYGAEAEERLSSTRVPGLINYLMREKHETPFENAGSITFYCKTPIFIAREHFRHRIGWSYNEVSGRYSELKPHFFLPPVGRPLIQYGKVGEYTFKPGTIEQEETVRESLVEASEAGWKNYVTMKDAGVANEVARMALTTNWMTEYYCTCNPRSLLHFLNLRTASNAQQEIQSLAGKMENIFKDLMPLTYQAWKDNQ